MEKHERFTIDLSFTVCDGLKDKALEEIKVLTNYITANSLSHSSDMKIRITHTPIE